jgi:hypothetical protein
MADDLTESLHEVLGRASTPTSDRDVSLEVAQYLSGEQAEVAKVIDWGWAPASHDQDAVAYLTYLPRRAALGR